MITVAFFLTLLLLGAWKAGELVEQGMDLLRERRRLRKRTALDRLKLPRSRVVRMPTRRQRIDIRSL